MELQRRLGLEVHVVPKQAGGASLQLILPVRCCSAQRCSCALYTLCHPSVYVSDNIVAASAGQPAMWGSCGPSSASPPLPCIPSYPRQLKRPCIHPQVQHHVTVVAELARRVPALEFAEPPLRFWEKVFARAAAAERRHQP